MVTGEWPDYSIPARRAFLPARWLAWPWLYLVLLAVALAMLLLPEGRGPVRRTRTSVFPLSIVLLIAGFLPSVIFSQVPLLSWFAFGCLLAIGAFVVAGAGVVTDESSLDGTAMALTAAAVFLAARVIVWRFHEGFDTSAFQVRNTAWLGKLQITWVLTLLAPLLLARYAEARAAVARVVNGLAWLFSAAAIHLLGSRMGLVAFAVATVIVLGANRRYWRRWIPLLGVLAGPALVLVLLSPTASTHLVTSIVQFEGDPGIVMRQAVWRETARMIADHPIIGLGLGTYDDVAYSRYGTPNDRHFFRNGWHAHNVSLHLLAETGSVGFLAWAVAWLMIVRALGRTWRQGDAAQRLNGSAALSLVVAFFILSMTEDLIAARVHASLRMSLTLGLLLVYALRRSAGDHVAAS
jgi:O-antigen ligase